MPYKGQTYRIPFNVGGLKDDRNTDTIELGAMLIPTRNLNLHEGGRARRGGTAKVNATAISGGPRVMGGYDFRLASGSSFQVVATIDGKVWKTSTSTIKTGMSTANKFNFNVFNNLLYICDGDTSPQYWDGAAAGTSAIANPAADWSGAAQPFQMITHGRGNSRRNWAIFGNSVYASASGSGGEFITGVVKITIDTEDTIGLTGGIEFGDTLFLFSQDNAYIIDDRSFDTADWGYQKAPWVGGAAHWRLMAKVDNDVIIMSKDGTIYSLTAVQQYGNYKLAELSRPSFIDRYIREEVNLSSIDDFHMVFDKEIRAVRIFLIRSGQTTVDSSLVYFVDKAPNEAWMIQDNQQATSGFSASCSFQVYASGRQRVYTGDYSGFVWKLEENNKNDDSKSYYAGFKTVNFNMDNPRSLKFFRSAKIITEPEGSTTQIQVNWWVDGIFQGTILVSLDGGSSTYGSGQYGTARYGGNDFIENTFELGMAGKRIQFELFSNDVNEDFFLSQMLVDHEGIGGR